MQELELAGSLVAYLLCKVSAINVDWNMFKEHGNFFCFCIIAYYSIIASINFF